MKTVLFGGGFDPPHRGHEEALRAILKGVDPDRIIVLPSGKPPHKDLSGGAEDEGRMALCRAAFAPLSEKIVFSDYDLKQKGKCYTVNALAHFQQEDPSGELFLFTGTDQLAAFETWYRFEDILKIAVLVAMSRDGEKALLRESAARLRQNFGARVLLLEDEPVVVSSTRVREEVGKRGFSDYLSPAVNEIIARRGFYKSALNERRRTILDFVCASLDEERLSHSLGVERETVRLCELFSVPEKELRLGALLHDLARRWDTERQAAFLKEAGETVTPEDLASPAVLHGRCAALTARDEFGLDETVCSAIRYHTTGRKQMSLAEKILFFADIIEDTRRHRVCVEARSRFYAGLPAGREERLVWLDRCVLDTLNGTVSHLKQQGLPVHPLTLSAVDSLSRAER